MADEKSIYERWSEERLNPPLPKEWGLNEEDEAELLWPIWPLLFMGESDTGLYVETITDYVMDVLGLEYDGQNEDSKLWEKRVEGYVEELIKRRRAFAAELGITPEMQKNSNLNRAFAALEEEGVIARQNFTCCGTCASAEIWDEIDNSREWKGYIYFHQQDAESLAESGGTYVGFGSFLAYPRDENEWNALSDAQKEEISALHKKLSVELMKDTIIPVLEKHGLSVEWKGNFDTRPFIGGVEVYNIP